MVHLLDTRHFSSRPGVPPKPPAQRRPSGPPPLVEWRPKPHAPSPSNPAPTLTFQATPDYSYLLKTPAKPRRPRSRFPSSELNGVSRVLRLDLDTCFDSCSGQKENVRRVNLSSSVKVARTRVSRPPPLIPISEVKGKSFPPALVQIR